MVADVFDLPVESPAETEGAALGAALQALWAWRRHGGDTADIADVVREHVTMDAARAARPERERVQSYEQPYRRYLAHLDALRQDGTTAAAVD
jgi:xylulokinase